MGAEEDKRCEGGGSADDEGAKRGRGGLGGDGWGGGCKRTLRRTGVGLLTRVGLQEADDEADAGFSELA